MNIWVNGCFDILHTGHIDLLWYAKMYDTDGINETFAMELNTLYVGIDSDERVKQLKGDKRPINNQYNRGKIITNLKMVDSLVIFRSDDELRKFITRFDIDYMVIGDQYKDKPVIGEENAKHGVVYFPTDKRSTTNIIDKIKAL